MPSPGKMQHSVLGRKIPIVDLNVQASRRLRGAVRCPPNKSHSFRALIMASLADGDSHIHAPMISNRCVSSTMTHGNLEMGVAVR